MLTPTPSGPTAAPKTVANLPSTDLDMARLAVDAATEWQKRPALTLLWKTSAEFGQLAAAFTTSLTQADTAGDTLSPGTSRRDQLDTLINEKTKYVKQMLALKYDEENDGRGYYAEFGLVLRRGTYSFDNRQAERAQGLAKLVAALPKHGLDQQKYGLAFWQPIATEYAELVQQSTATKGTRSTSVASKDELREQAEDVLLALVSLLKANYPKTHRAELRAFGFQKESY